MITIYLNFSGGRSHRVVVKDGVVTSSTATTHVPVGSQPDPEVLKAHGWTFQRLNNDLPGSPYAAADEANHQNSL